MNKLPDTPSPEPTLVIFDLDGTLTESKTALDPEMAELLCQLLSRKKVAVITGASFDQLNTQFLSRLTCSGDADANANRNDYAVNLSNLSILPTNGASFYEYDAIAPGQAGGDQKNKWRLVYKKAFSIEEKKKINDALASVLAGLESDPALAPVFLPEKIYGKQIEDRDSQITFSAVGQDAPLAVKKSWDPNHAKRQIMAAKLRILLPDFQISMGGMTSLDITKQGVDKEHGINALVEHFSIPKTSIVYVGDAIFPGGNDYGAVTAGVPTHSVTSVSETKDFIRGIIKSK